MEKAVTNKTEVYLSRDELCKALWYWLKSIGEQVPKDHSEIAIRDQDFLMPDPLHIEWQDRTESRLFT